MEGVLSTTFIHGYCAVLYASRKINEVVSFILFKATLVTRITESKQKQHYFITFADCAKIFNV